MGRVKICSVCGAYNELTRPDCIDCSSELSGAEEVDLEEREATKVQEEDHAGSEFSGQGQPRAKCPICSMELDAEMQCPRHPRRRYRLTWPELGVMTQIPDNKPLFVGRISPVDDDLAQRIEKGFPTVSRIHAELSMGQDGHLYLRDMGSRNGTCIDNQPLDSPFTCHKLQVGAELSFSSKLHAKVELA